MIRAQTIGVKGEDADPPQTNKHLCLLNIFLRTSVHLLTNVNFRTVCLWPTFESSNQQLDFTQNEKRLKLPSCFKYSIYSILSINTNRCFFSLNSSDRVQSWPEKPTAVPILSSVWAEKSCLNGGLSVFDQRQRRRGRCRRRRRRRHRRRRRQQ